MWKMIISEVFEIFSKEFSLNPLDSMRLNQTQWNWIRKMFDKNIFKENENFGFLLLLKIESCIWRFRKHFKPKNPN